MRRLAITTALLLAILIVDVAAAQDTPTYDSSTPTVTAAVTRAPRSFTDVPTPTPMLPTDITTPGSTTTTPTGTNTPIPPPPTPTPMPPETYVPGSTTPTPAGTNTTVPPPTSTPIAPTAAPATATAQALNATVQAAVRGTMTAIARSNTRTPTPTITLIPPDPRWCGRSERATVIFTTVGQIEYVEYLGGEEAKEGDKIYLAVDEETRVEGEIGPAAEGMIEFAFDKAGNYITQCGFEGDLGIYGPYVANVAWVVSGPDETPTITPTPAGGTPTATSAPKTPTACAVEIWVDSRIHICINSNNVLVQ